MTDKIKSRNPKFENLDLKQLEDQLKEINKAIEEKEKRNDRK